jgi:hypothetical protein
VRRRRGAGVWAAARGGHGAGSSSREGDCSIEREEHGIGGEKGLWRLGLGECGEASRVSPWGVILYDAVKKMNG